MSIAPITLQAYLQSLAAKGSPAAGDEAVILDGGAALKRADLDDFPGGITIADTAPDPAEDGELWFDTTEYTLYFRDEGVWIEVTEPGPQGPEGPEGPEGPPGASGSGSGDLLASANLSDLDDAAEARTNLGLGTAATTASTDYATAAQGTDERVPTDGSVTNAKVNASAAIAQSKIDGLTTDLDAKVAKASVPVTLTIAVGDETTAITTGTAKVTFRMPHAMTLTGVRASLSTASSSGLPTFDINEGGASVLSTKLSVDESEKTSTTAATPAVISDSALADDAEITIDIDVAGTGAKGPKITLIGTRSV